MARTKAFDEQLVLEKAMNLFWRKGYHATSVQDLVDELGINRGSLYATFGGKKELFNRAFQHYRTINTANVRGFLAKEKNVKAGLHKLLTHAIDESVNDPESKGCFVVNTTTELIPSDADLLPEVQDNQRIFEQVFYDYLQQGVTNGEIHPGKDLRGIAGMIFTFYNGFRVVGKLRSDPAQLKKSVNLVLGVLD